MSFKSIVVWLLLATFSHVISAAEEGEAGRVSVGKVDIGLTIPDTIRFAVEVDVDERGGVISHGVSANGPLTQTDACLIFTGSGRYSIIATTDSGDFLLHKTRQAASAVKPDDVDAGHGNSAAHRQSLEADDAIGFVAYWHSSAQADKRTQLSYGLPLTGQRADQLQTQECMKGKRRGNSSFSIQVEKSSAAKVRAGSYRTTISVVISPE